jgi:DEAD/DEAH box helicase domain-containing protein
MVLGLLLDRPEAREFMLDRSVSADREECPAPLEREEEPPPAPGGARVLVLDIETLRGADEVGGWGNAHLMGMALAVVWDSSTEGFTTFFEDQAAELLGEMARADLVVGFNIVGFDYRVLAAYDDGSLARVATFDILQDVRRRLGFRLSLAHLAEKTLGASKSADGLQSLRWVREGRLDLVEEYCRQDVQITVDLLFHGIAKKRVRFEDREGRLLELAVDWDLEKTVQRAREAVRSGGGRRGE